MRAFEVDAGYNQARFASQCQESPLAAFVIGEGRVGQGSKVSIGRILANRELPETTETLEKADARRASTFSTLSASPPTENPL